MPEFTGRLRTPRLPSAPASPVVGELYYDTSTNILYWWNGTAWVSASGGGSDNLRYNGDWVAGSYLEGDVVVYGGVSYLAVKPTSVAPTPWPVVTPSGGGVDYIGNWGAGTAYKKGDVVRYNNNDYVAVNDSTGVAPPAPASPYAGGATYLGFDITAANYDLAHPSPTAAVTTIRSNAGGGSLRTISAASAFGAKLEIQNWSGSSAITLLHAASGAGVSLYMESLQNVVLQKGWCATFTYIPGLWWMLTALTPMSGIAYGTSLPTNPVDGQEAILVDSITNPSYEWRFRYNAGSSSAYKWEFIGGSETWGVAAQGVYGALPSGSSAQAPIFITPRAGDWDLQAGAQFTGGTPGSYCALSVGSSGGSGQGGATSLPAANYHFTVVNAYRSLAVASGTQFSLFVTASHADMSSANRWMRIRPVRVS